MDRLQAMSTFVAVVDSGGFAKAARRLGLSPPQVTRAVAELEARLGLRLMNRTTRALRLTDAGVRYADDCRRILAEVQEAELAASGAHDTPQGTLTVTAPVLLGHLHVAPLVTRYLREHPRVDAQCLFLDRVVHLMDEGVDVAVRIGELPDSSMRAIAVGKVRRVLVASPDYLAARGAPQRPEDLAGHSIVSAAGMLGAPEWRFVEDGAMRAVRVTPRLRTTTNESAIAAAVEGLGIARLLSYQVADRVRAGELAIVLQDFETAPLPVHVVHLEGRRATRKVRDFVELAVESLRANPALR